MTATSFQVLSVALLASLATMTAVAAPSALAKTDTHVVAHAEPAQKLARVDPKRVFKKVARCDPGRVRHLWVA